MKERITVPIYEFVCQACGNEFEQILSFSDNSTPACSKCGSDQVVRQVGRPAIHFKGSGWYINDSKKSGDKSGASKNSASGESSKSSTSDDQTESKPETKSETKPETKTETKSESTAPAPVASE